MSDTDISRLVSPIVKYDGSNFVRWNSELRWSLEPRGLWEVIQNGEKAAGKNGPSGVKSESKEEPPGKTGPAKDEPKEHDGGKSASSASSSALSSRSASPPPVDAAVRTMLTTVTAKAGATLSHTDD